jgi:RNAse (barnase) inhibitor barstar
MFYGHLCVYLKNPLKLAWKKFPDHDQRGLIAMVEEFVEVEDQLNKDNQYGSSLMDIFDGFG